MRRVRPSYGAPVALVAVFAFVAGLIAALPASAEMRSVVLALESADLAPGPVEAESPVRASATDLSAASWLTSSVQDPRQSFAAVGSHWMDAPGTQLQLSVSPDGVHWGRWITVPADETIGATREDGEPNPFAGETIGALVFVDPASRFLLCRLRRSVDSPGSPEPGRITLHVIHPGTSTPRNVAVLSRRAAAPPPEPPGPTPGAPKPPIFTRAEWGARPPRTAYTATLAGHIGIHHTATVEDFAASTWQECAARVRAIQTYHIDTQGWNDIGYAYVVCKHGHIFQAREDDDDTTDLQGAHDGFNKGSAGISALGYFHPPVDHQPTEAQLSAIVQLTAWIASRRGIDPLGRSLYPALGAVVDNVYGHRQVSATDCPGDILYARMEALRTAVGDLVLQQLY